MNAKKGLAKGNADAAIQRKRQSASVERKAQPKLPEELNQPILRTLMFPFNVVPGENASEQAHAYKRRLEELHWQRILLLFKHYKIPLTDRRKWELLARNLANDFVPAMEVIDRFKRRGSPQGEWGRRLARAFVEAVDEIRGEEPKLTVPAAIEVARSRIPELKGNVNSLKTRYYELRKELKKRSNAPISATMLADFLKRPK